MKALGTETPEYSDLHPNLMNPESQIPYSLERIE